MGNRHGVSGGGRGVLWLIVLAIADMARAPGGNRRCIALAMVGGDSVGAGIRGGGALRLGFRMVDVVLLRPWRRRSDWWWPGSTAMSEIPCTLASQWDGSGFG